MKALLMGGQACILYGAAEFSRDVDLVVAVAPRNLARLRAALDELQAEPVFFPELSAAVLRRGHACHFRCLAPGLHGLRIDVMSKLRGVEPFARLWKRRVVLDLPGVGPLAVMALRDLVLAKKTQRDKDWPMVRRLIEADVARAPERPGPARVRLWLREGRTFDLLRDLSRRYPRLAAQVGAGRPALKAAASADEPSAVRLLAQEEERERQRDRRYWAPLRAELERWRRGRSRE